MGAGLLALIGIVAGAIVGFILFKFWEKNL